MHPAGNSDAGLPAGAVAVPVPGVEAAAAPAAAARPSCAQLVARVTKAWLGTAGAGAVRRVAWAAALVVLGCAAAGLACFAMTLPAAAGDSRLPELQKGAVCAPTITEAAGLRIASQGLLLAASTQVVAASLGLLFPSRLVAVFVHSLGWLTADSATDVVWLLAATCHGASADDADLIWSSYRLFRDVLWAARLVGVLVSIW